MKDNSINDGSNNSFLESNIKEEIPPLSEEGLTWLDKSELAIQNFLIVILNFDEHENYNDFLKHLDEVNKLCKENSRLLYSPITNFIYSLEIEKYDIFMDKLRNFTLNFDKEDPNFEVLLKIFDHCHLATHQKEYHLKVTQNFSEMDSKIQNNIRDIHRNNVTILGIFTSIVATFFGLFTFSASIFNNIVDTNFFKLIVVSSLIGVFFYGTIYLLINFIAKIINIEVKFNSSIVPTLLFVTMLIFTFLAYAGAFDVFSNCLQP